MAFSVVGKNTEIKSESVVWSNLSSISSVVVILGSANHSYIQYTVTQTQYHVCLTTTEKDKIHSIFYGKKKEEKLFSLHICIYWKGYTFQHITV